MFDLKKLKKIELVLFDVDGTLVNDEGEIGERTKHLVKDQKTWCSISFNQEVNFSTSQLPKTKIITLIS
jgi:beta-phosphoglucomutase-like phosphatase (HAD superfamily)